jgi:hypothetical protein
MSNFSAPILLTSSVTPYDKTVKLVNPEERILYTIESIGEWLKIAPDAKYVICDGSNFNFEEIVKREFPGALIECLFFLNDPKIIEVKGKGYGEGEIIKYALENSIFLKSADFFVKCTGKLWVNNYYQCIKNFTGVFLCQAYFKDVFSFKKTSLKYIDTRFYVLKKDFYEKYFLNAHYSLSIELGYGIEESFRDIALKNDLKNFLFKVTPRISGVGGGSGNYYKISYRRRLKDALRIYILKGSPRYKDLFSDSFS